jgi:hypothetical protein
MRQETYIQNLPVCAAVGKKFDVFSDGLNGLGADLEAPVICSSKFGALALRDPSLSPP